MLNIIKLLKKKLYKLLIYKILFLDKKNILYYSRLTPFSTITLHTNKGDFIFSFKQDRRVKRRLKDSLFRIKTFIIELKLPKDLMCKVSDIEDKVLIVITICGDFIDYKLLSEVLLETYCSNIKTFN